MAKNPFYRPRPGTAPNPFYNPNAKPAPAPTPNPAPPAAVPPPVSLSAGASINNALQNYNTTIGGLGQQEQQAGLEFGFNPNGTLDPTTPYGRAQLLDRSYTNTTRGTTNSMAARGQLYAGSTQNAQNANTFGYLSNRDALLKQYQSILSRIALARQQAKNNYNATGTTAQGAAADAGFTPPSFTPIV